MPVSGKPQTERRRPACSAARADARGKVGLQSAGFGPNSSAASQPDPAEMERFASASRGAVALRPCHHRAHVACALVLPRQRVASTAAPPADQHPDRAGRHRAAGAAAVARFALHRLARGVLVQVYGLPRAVMAWHGSSVSLQAALRWMMGRGFCAAVLEMPAGLLQAGSHAPCCQEPTVS
jgi:hypothetical protein